MSAKPKVCSIADCNGAVVARGWCWRHYQRWRRHDDPLHVKNVVEGGRRCSVDGCDRKHAALGYCKYHYTNFREHGSPGRVHPRRHDRNRKCKTPGCGRKHAGRGLCRTCYMRVYYRRRRTEADHG